MKYLIVVVFLMLSACASKMTPENAGSETLLFNPVISGNSMEVSVMSNGCTKPGHFYLIVEADIIELRRSEADLCRAAPELVRLAFEYPFGQALFQFKNDVRYSNRIKR